MSCNNSTTNQEIAPNYKFNPIGDQAFFEVKGPVQKIIGNIPNFECINLNNVSDDIVTKRNGIIKREVVALQTTEYKYNNNGYISKTFDQLEGGRYSSSYKYNDDNLLLEVYTEGGYYNSEIGDLVEENSTTTYEYLVIDDYGNWLERIAINSKTGEKTTEKRIITYFSDPIEIQKYKIL